LELVYQEMEKYKDDSEKLEKGNVYQENI
ncbi:hypothetical protein LCGC14_2875270, partial [marine sediment metagenome]